MNDAGAIMITILSSWYKTRVPEQHDIVPQMSSLPQSMPAINVAPQMGPLLIGLILGCVFFGITTLQALFYYTTYSDDRAFLKSLVALLWMLDAASLALVTHTVYYSLVLNYANPLALVEIPWGLASEPIISATVTLIVHLFLSYRVYALRHSLAPLAIGYAIFSLVPMITGLICVGRVLAAGHDEWAVVQESLFGLATASNVTSAAIDIALAGTLFILFRQNNVVFARTGKVLRMLSMYAIATGLFTTMIVIASMISQTVPTNGTLIFPIFNIMVSKSYANSLMATLNARQNIRGQLEDPPLALSGFNSSTARDSTNKPKSAGTRVTRSSANPGSAIVFNHSYSTTTTDSTAPPMTIHSILESDREIQGLKSKEYDQYHIA